ncbi:MAG: hypothetical protein V4613_09365 [Bacteroidota bacterium]
MKAVILLAISSLMCLNHNIDKETIKNESIDFKLIEGDNFLIYTDSKDPTSPTFKIINKNKDTFIESWCFAEIDSGVNIKSFTSLDIKKYIALANKIGKPSVYQVVYIQKDSNKINKIDGEPFIDLKAEIFGSSDLQLQHIFFRKNPKNGQLFHFLYLDMFRSHSQREYIYYKDLWVIAYIWHDYPNETQYVKLKMINDRIVDVDSMLKW